PHPLTLRLPGGVRPDARLRALAALIDGEELLLPQPDVLVDLKVQRLRRPPHDLVRALPGPVKAGTHRVRPPARAQRRPDDTFPAQLRTARWPGRHGRPCALGWRMDGG